MNTTDSIILSLFKHCAHRILATLNVFCNGKAPHEFEGSNDLRYS